MKHLTDEEILDIATRHCEFTAEGAYHLRKFRGWAIVDVVRECFELAELTGQSLQAGYMEAFYEMAAMLGIKGARAKSPQEVYEDEIKPALEILIACATEPEAKECRHCDIRAASYRVIRPSSFHYADCPHGVEGTPAPTDDEAFRQFQRDRIAEAQRHDAEQAKPKLAPGVMGSMEGQQ